VKTSSSDEYEASVDLQMKGKSRNGSSFAAVTEPDFSEEKPPSPELRRQNKSSLLRSHKSTGPRTQRGKDKSKNNALKHGMFSKPVVLEGESQSEFRALHNGLREDFQPVGTLEEVLVEKLAALLWRNRRLIIAEAAEIRVAATFCEWDLRERHREEASQFPEPRWNGGLIKRIANPEALEGCLSLLRRLKDGIEETNFDTKCDEEILDHLFGNCYDRRADWRQGIRYSYWCWSGYVALCKEKGEEGLATFQRCKDEFLAELRHEVKRLERYKKEQVAVLTNKLELESLRQYVPDSTRFDRLLRYETTLERSIERLLNQLERTQRMRQGEPVPTPINLNVTTSKE